MLVPRHMNISTPSIHVGKLLAADQQCKVSNEYRSDITASSSTQAVCLHSTISKPKSAVGYSVNMALADALAVNAEKASAADLDKWIYAPEQNIPGLYMHTGLEMASLTNHTSWLHMYIGLDMASPTNHTAGLCRLFAAYSNHMYISASRLLVPSHGCLVKVGLISINAYVV